MLHYETNTEDLEQEGRVETLLIGLRYAGPKSSVSPSTPRQQGGWPGTATFQGGPPTERNDDGRVVERDPGPVQLGINPDWVADDVDGGTIAGLEALPNFEVIYETDRLAVALLDLNFLPPVVFGSPPEQTGERVTPDFAVREAVFDQLDLDDVGSGPNSHETYREQLAELAGVDLTGSDESPTDSTRAQQYVDEYTRSELSDAAKAVREDTDEFSLRGKQKLEIAEWLATQDAQTVRDAFATDDE